MATARQLPLVLSRFPSTLPFYGRATAVLLLMLLLAGFLSAGEDTRRTLQSFGVCLRHGQPVYPLPSSVALGLFNSDPLLDVAYYADGRAHVYLNLGNGTFGTEPLWEERVTGTVEKLEWRTTGNLTASIADPGCWGELVIHYAAGRSEAVSHKEMLSRRDRFPAGGFASFPPPDPPLSFHEVWRSEANRQPATMVEIADIDNDGRNEVIYPFYSGVTDSTSRIVVYENTGNDQYVIDWDTTLVHGNGGPFALTDIDNDGHKEFIGVGTNVNIGYIAVFECFGPRRYRYYSSNIGFMRPVFAVQETDVDHDGTKELTVLTSDPSATYDETLVYVAEFVTKAIGPNGWSMVFNQQLARYQGYTFNMAVGQVDGQSWDEIIPAGGSFGYQEPVPVDYLWYTGIPGPNLWQTRGIYTGLQSGTGAVMFVNLDADTTMEFVSGAPGPVGHGSMFALKYQHDTTWSVMWADSNLRNSPLWVNNGMLNGQFVVAGANYWMSGMDSLYSQLHVYETQGQKFGSWRRDSLVIEQFHLLDIDRDGRTNLIFAQVANFNHRLVDYESDTVIVWVGSQRELPQQAQLAQNYPNPFNPSTSIRVAIPRTEEIKLVVFNLVGQEVALLMNEEKAPGTYDVVWDASGFASGVFFCQLRTESQIITKKMLLLR